MNIRAFVKRLIFGYKASSNDYLSYLCSKGASIGDDVIIYSSNHMDIND